jgi:hypothetical protein
MVYRVDFWLDESMIIIRTQFHLKTNKAVPRK